METQIITFQSFYVISFSPSTYTSDYTRNFKRSPIIVGRHHYQMYHIFKEKTNSLDAKLFRFFKKALTLPSVPLQSVQNGKRNPQIRRKETGTETRESEKTVIERPTTFRVLHSRRIEVERAGEKFKSHGYVHILTIVIDRKIKKRLRLGKFFGRRERGRAERYREKERNKASINVYNEQSLYSIQCRECAR